MKSIERWEQIHGQRTWGHYPNEELVRFIGRNLFKLSYEERKNVKILEVGCGQGANIWFLAKEGFTTHGIDVSTSAVTKAEKFLAETHGVKAFLEVADLRDLPYESGVFDVVIDNATIQHVSFLDHEKAYKEIYRVLKPGKKFWCFHIAKGSWGYGTGNMVDSETFDNLTAGPLAGTGTTCMLTAEDITGLLNKAGIRITSLEKHLRTFNNQENELIHWIIEAKRDG
ncbi:MAG: class I SAM-dependent methyltransferase [Candidatus Odinarchaeota archaeon]